MNAVGHAQMHTLENFEERIFQLVLPSRCLQSAETSSFKNLQVLNLRGNSIKEIVGLENLLR